MKKKSTAVISLLLIFLIAFSAVPPAPTAVVKEDSFTEPFLPVIEKKYEGVSDYIAEQVKNLESEIEIVSYNVTSDDIMDVFKNAIFTHPEIFYVDTTHINYKHDQEKIVHFISPTYTVEKSKIASLSRKLNNAVDSIIDGIDEEQNTYAKLLEVHDRIIESCEYKEVNKLSYTSYGALVNKKAVCEGYSKAFSLILSKLRIENKLIDNNKKEHCWNLVRLGQNWYHIDLTSDDPTPDKTGQVTHKYFLLSDQKLDSYKSDNHLGFRSDASRTDYYECSSTSYDKTFVRNIKTRVAQSSGRYFYIDNNVGGKGTAALIRRNGSEKKTLKSFKDRWYTTSGKVYLSSYSFACIKDGYYYFNSKNELYRCNLSNSKVEKLFAKPSFWSGDFYGIKSSGNYILATRQTSPNGAAKFKKILLIKSNGNALKLPVIRKTSVTLKRKSTYTMKVYFGSGKVTYKTTNKKIAKVNSKGTVTALRKGSCTITAVKNGVKLSCKIKVN